MKPAWHQVERWIGVVGGVCGTVVGVLALHMSCAVRSDEARAEAQSLNARAMALGRRASVYESLREMADSALVLEPLSDRARHLGKAGAERADLFEGAVMAVAAKDMGIELMPTEEPWRLDMKIRGQLRDRYTHEVATAYDFGRRLGYCDERATLCVVVSETGRAYGCGAVVADSGAFEALTSEVDSMLSELKCPIEMRWQHGADLWLRLAQGRAVLESVSEWLVWKPHSRRRWAVHPAVDENWAFGMMLRRDRGGPRGYSTVLEPGALTRKNSTSFEADFRRIAWAREVKDAGTFREK